MGTGLVVLLGALSAFAPLSIDTYLPALPSLAVQLHASTLAAQLTLTACLFGLGAGQLAAGPVSDALGRRRPILAGIGAYALVSLLCALAPSVWALVGLRLLQGAAGGAAIVIARAMVRDLRSGNAAARLYATLMLVNGMVPVLAPVLGAQLLRVVPWRGIFVTLSLVGLALLAATAHGLPETRLAGARRRVGPGLGADVFLRLLADRTFVACAASCGLAVAAMFAYIAGSPFVLQDMYRLSPQAFSAVFAVNALGIVALSQVGGLLVGRLGARPLLGLGLVLSAAGGLSLLAGVLLHGGLACMLPSLFAVVASVGLVQPNAVALALADHPDVAGSASALVGLGQLLFGGLAAPLVGLGAGATPMAAVIATSSAGGLLWFALAARRPQR